MVLTRALGSRVLPLVLVVLGSVLATAPAHAEGTAPAAASPLRVMIEGDSITHGRNGEATYRYYLWREFQRQGVPVDFVGPYDGLRKRADAPLHYWFNGFDHDHASRSGTTFAMHRETQDEWLRTYRPDVVVLMLGMNDASRMSGDAVAAQAVEFMEHAWTIDPDLRFVMGQVTETANPKSRPGKNEATALANRLVAEHFLGELRVTFAHTRTGATAPAVDWDPRRLTFDGTHANATGDTFLAHRFAQALHEAGFLPRGDIAIYRHVVWDPRPRAQVAVSGRRVTFSWLPARLRLFDAQERLVVHRRDGRRVAASGWRSTTSWSVTLPRGRYVVRVAPHKGTMTGRFGPPVAFRVR